MPPADPSPAGNPFVVRLNDRLEVIVAQNCFWHRAAHASKSASCAGAGARPGQAVPACRPAQRSLKRPWQLAPRAATGHQIAQAERCSQLRASGLCGMHCTQAVACQEKYGSLTSTFLVSAATKNTASSALALPGLHKVAHAVRTVWHRTNDRSDCRGNGTPSGVRQRDLHTSQFLSSAANFEASDPITYA